MLDARAFASGWEGRPVNNLNFETETAGWFATRRWMQLDISLLGAYPIWQQTNNRETHGTMMLVGVICPVQSIIFT